LDFLILICYKDVADKKNINSELLSVIRLTSGILIAFSSFSFGILMDKYGFRILLFLITIIEIVISASLYFIVINDYIFIIFIILILLCVGGTFSILAPEFNKIFGVTYGAEVYGLTAIFIGFAHLNGSILSRFILKNNFDYILSFLIGGSLCLIKLGILMFFKEKKYINIKYISKNIINDSGRESSLTDDLF
jgi:MFS family permease